MEAILIGNAAATLQGAPVTTIDVDFMFRDTPLNRKRLKLVAKDLCYTIFRPFYPTSRLFRLISEVDATQIDLMPQIHGVSSFASLRSRASETSFGSATLLVAALEDIIKSKRAAGRDKDKAVLGILERTLREKKAKIS